MQILTTTTLSLFAPDMQIIQTLCLFIHGSEFSSLQNVTSDYVHVSYTRWV